MNSFKNRIIGHGEESPEQLLANPLNWRIHPDEQQKALTGAMREVGIVQSVIVNQRTGHLVDGHLRVQIAMKNNQSTIPVVYVDLSEQEEAIILATIDPITGMAVTDRIMLDSLLAQIDVEDEDLNRLLESMKGAQAEVEPGESIRDDGDRLLLLVETNSERELESLFSEMKSRGYECKLMN